MHKYTYTHMHVHAIHMYLCVCAHVCMCTFIERDRYVYMCTCVYVYVYIYILELAYRFKAICKWTYRSRIGPKVDGQHALSMYFFFYIVDGWSIVKLTGSMYSLCTLSSTFSIDGRS